jgi:hypothetical protein
MKNTTSLILTLALILSSGLACSLVSHAEKNSPKDTTGSGKSLEDRGVDIVVGEKKIGVQECDEVIEFFNKEMDSPDDGFVTKAVKKTVLNQLKDQFRQAIEENKTDKKELAKVCKDFKQNLEHYKQESEKK